MDASWWTPAGVEGLQTDRVKYEDAVLVMYVHAQARLSFLAPKGASLNVLPPCAMSGSVGLAWGSLSWVSRFPSLRFPWIQHAGKSGSVERLRIALCE